MKKYLFSLLAVLLMTACSNDDGDMASSDSPVPVAASQADYRDSLSVFSKEAAKRLVGKWKDVYKPWPGGNSETVEGDHSYVRFYDDNRLEVFSDIIPWDSTEIVKVLIPLYGEKAHCYRVLDDWKYDDNTHTLSGHIVYPVRVDPGNNFIDYGERYYCSFGGNDSYDELYMIEDPTEYINCFGYGVGYIRVK